MNKFPIYNCPDILLYDYDNEYNKLYQSKVYELEGALQLFDNDNRLNEVYKHLLRYERLSPDKKLKFDTEINNIRLVLINKVKSALDKGYELISVADPLSSIEFLGLKAAKMYLDIFLLDFLYDIKQICKGRAFIHLCPKLSILLIKAMETDKKRLEYKAYTIKVDNVKLDKTYPSIIHALLHDRKREEIISGLKCIHFFGKTDSVAVIKFNKKDIAASLLK